MNVIKQNFKQYLKALNIVHAALLLGAVLFAAMTLFLNQTNGIAQKDAEMENIFLVMVPLFFLGSFVANYILIPKRLEKDRKEKDLSSKLDSYRATQIVKFAIMEGPAFFAIVTFLITGSYLLIGFAGMIMVLFATYFPTKEKIVNELELNRKEQDILKDENATVLEFTQK